MGENRNGTMLVAMLDESHERICKFDIEGLAVPSGLGNGDERGPTDSTGDVGRIFSSVFVPCTS